MGTGTCACGKVNFHQPGSTSERLCAQKNMMSRARQEAAARHPTDTDHDGPVLIGGNEWDPETVTKIDRWKDVAATASRATKEALIEGKETPNDVLNRYRQEMHDYGQSEGLAYDVEDDAVRLDRDRSVDEGILNRLGPEDVDAATHTGGVVSGRLAVPDRARWLGPGVSFDRLSPDVQRAFMAGQAHGLAETSLRNHFRLESTVKGYEAQRAAMTPDAQRAYDAGQATAAVQGRFETQHRPGNGNDLVNTGFTVVRVVGARKHEHVDGKVVPLGPGQLRAQVMGSGEVRFNARQVVDSDVGPAVFF